MNKCMRISDMSIYTVAFLKGYLRAGSGSRVHSTLTTNLSGDIDKTTIVNLSLLCTTSLGFLLFLLSNLGGLRLNLTSTS